MYFSLNNMVFFSVFILQYIAHTPSSNQTYYLGTSLRSPIYITGSWSAYTGPVGTGRGVFDTCGLRAEDRDCLFPTLVPFPVNADHSRPPYIIPSTQDVGNLLLSDSLWNDHTSSHYLGSKWVRGEDFNPSLLGANMVQCNFRYGVVSPCIRACLIALEFW